MSIPSHYPYTLENSHYTNTHAPPWQTSKDPRCTEENDEDYDDDPKALYTGILEHEDTEASGAHDYTYNNFASDMHQQRTCEDDVWTGSNVSKSYKDIPNAPFPGPIPIQLPTPQPGYSQQRMPYNASLTNDGFEEDATMEPDSVGTSTRIECQYDGCDAVFTGRYARGNMGRHARWKHDQGKPFKCSVPGCGKTFRWQEMRDKHYRKCSLALQREGCDKDSTQ